MSYFCVLRPSCCLREEWLCSCKWWPSLRCWEKQINGLLHLEVVAAVSRKWPVKAHANMGGFFHNRKPAMLSKGWENIDHGPIQLSTTSYTWLDYSHRCLFTYSVSTFMSKSGSCNRDRMTYRFQSIYYLIFSSKVCQSLVFSLLKLPARPREIQEGFLMAVHHPLKYLFWVCEIWVMLSHVLK